MWLAWLAFGSCVNAPDVDPDVDHLVRASMALRGLRPSADEVRTIHDEPHQLAPIVRSWFDDPAFADTVRDMAAEWLLVRNDVTIPPPVAAGPLAAVDEHTIRTSGHEEPLKLVERVVVEGRPFTDIVTSGSAFADPIVAAAYGMPYDEAGPHWQETAYADGRPAAGILASTSLWRRHQSANGNFQRGRAAWILETLLCDDLALRGLVGATDPTRQEDAIRDDPECAACHAVLDPVASSLWGIHRYIVRPEILDAYAAGCEGEYERYCYPLGMWDPAQVDTWRAHDLPEPALYGQPVDGLRGLGQAIAANPRFATCTAKRFWSWTTRTSIHDPSDALVDALAHTLVENDWDARELLVDLVTRPEFGPQAGLVPPQTVRPEQLARSIEALTGYVWAGTPDDDDCASSPAGCHGPVEYALADVFGFRTMLGGLDGRALTAPEPGALPTRELTIQWLADEASDFAVHHASEPESAASHLFPNGFPTEEAAVRQQLAWMHLVVLSQVETPESDVVSHSTDLWKDIYAATQSATDTWRAVLSAFLQDHRMVVF